MNESLGARLRLRREQQRIALITIAEQTKIKVSLLEALERDDVSQWPSGIFRRAFVRAYAHAIGLDPDIVVREFLDLYPDPIEVVATDSQIASGGDGIRASGGPPTRLHYLVDSAIGVLSRLRRTPAVQELAAADRAPVSVPVPSVPDLPAAAHPSTEAGRAETKEAVADGAAVNGPTPSGPDLPAAAHPSAEPGRVLDTQEVVADGTAVNHPAAPEPDLAAAAVPSSAPNRVDATDEVAADSAPVNEPAASEPDLLAAAHLCTEFGRVQNTTEVQPLLQEAARILDAPGLIVWMWDPLAEQLRPALAHGYSEKVLAQLPTVGRDADNATAAAFRSAQTCAINGDDHASGALVVPLLTPAGCAGVLAIELQHGSERTRAVRALATIFAAQLAQLIRPL